MLEDTSTTTNDGHVASPADEDLGGHWNRVIGRRAFLRGAGVAGATALAGSGLLAAGAAASVDTPTAGDIAILRFLCAAEILETDLWEQYEELGGVNGGNSSYMLALENLDGDMPQYISDNTDDERSHAAFLNAYLRSQGAMPVNLDRFRTLPSSKATGAKQIGRLTNLMSLNVDTSWYTRYRSTQNPDFGASFPQAVHIQNQPAIPLNDHGHTARHGSAGAADYQARAPYAGDRQRGRVPLRDDRAGWLQPLHHDQPEGLVAGGAADHRLDRRSRGRPLRGLARQGRKRRGAAAGGRDRPRDRNPLP